MMCALKFFSVPSESRGEKEYRCDCKYAQMTLEKIHGTEVLTVSHLYLPQMLELLLEGFEDLFLCRFFQ